MLFRFDGQNHQPYLLLQSKEQIHSFNTPFQVTRLPTIRELDVLRMNGLECELHNLRQALKKRTFCEDQPEDSDIYQVRVREGDLIIACTDGVFDNLFLEEIVDIVKETTHNVFRTKQTAQHIAKRISDAARLKSGLDQVRTPYGVKKQKYHNKGQVIYHGDIAIKDEGYEECKANGGKNDDTTTLAIWITQKNYGT